MKVDGRETRAVGWEVEGIRFIDQRRLPFTLAFGLARDVEEVARAIEQMSVRGAPAIGVMAAYGLALAAHRGEPLDRAFRRLLDTRPTAVNLRAGLEVVMKAAPGPQAMLEAARAHDRSEVAAAEAIGTHGLSLFRHGTRVLTHCNAGWLAVQDWGTALAPVYQAARAGLEPYVYVSETRPRLQGARLTAWELAQEGIAHALIADGAAADLMRRDQVDLVLTGADRIAANGDVANKIGTYAHALAARAHGIAFYVAAPLTTVDRSVATGAEIPIEERDPEEVCMVEGADSSGAIVKVRIAPQGTRALNPAFDVTPHECVSGIITEVGIVAATAEGIAEAFREAETVRISARRVTRRERRYYEEG